MRKIIEKSLPPFLTEALEAAKQKRRRYFGLNDLDAKLERHLDFDDGYFVELGANNGISQ